ncbi:phage tail-collar fiber domain-containing protein [Vibrio cholerae]|uniref:phage tail-collar fiber domain-containing protein n=1 Tax=Vibrio cholerae TaxID=666 RepID=UPI00372D51C6
MSIPESALNYGSILTLAGENAEINGKLNSKSINFTHIAIGDANDVYVQPSRTQTALVHELARIPITGMEKITPSKPDAVPQLKVWAKIPDDIVDIAVREFAAVATFDGTSYLHAVGNTVRIPILSGSNNGGEVNDIYIEMTFAVTSLDPIVMIDPTIVTATRKFVRDEDAKHLVAENPHPQYPLASSAQFLAYNPVRIYSAGEVCYTKDAESGELSYWQWYSNVESLAGKTPLDIANRHAGWQDNTKPFYWIPYTGDQVGMPFFWLAEEAPEWAVMEINVDLPIAVYWRLARRYPDLVNGNVINTGEIRDEFLRVWDNGRGRTQNRELNSTQAPTQIPFVSVHNTGATRYLVTPPINSFSDSLYPTNAEERLVGPQGIYYQGAVTNAASGSNSLISYATYPRNTARAMAIAI